jgi:hypothetical protein
VTTCANPACENTLPARARTGRPAIYCSPACRQRQRRNTTRTDTGDAATSDDTTVIVELEHPATSPDGRPPDRIWTLRLRRDEHVVVIAEGLGWPTANALARQLEDLLAPPTTATGHRRPAATETLAEEPTKPLTVTTQPQGAAID